MLKFIAAGDGSTAPDDFSPERIRTWLASLAGADVTGAARAVIERLVQINKLSLHGEARLEALDLFREHVEWLLPQLEGRIARAQPPLADALRQTAYCIEKLLKELGTGYARIVLRAPRAWLSGGYKRRLHAPLTRALDFRARRLALSQRMYTRTPSGVWTEMHQLFRLARDWGIADREIESPRASPLSIYRDALLVAFAEPTKLMHGDLLRIQSYLLQYGQLAEIAPRVSVDSSPCVFAIDARRDQAGVAHAKRSDAGFDNGELMLLTRKLVERVESHLRKLSDRIAPGSLGLPSEAVQPHYQELLQRLAAQWRGERKQRAARMRFHPRVDLWAGLREIWRLLRTESPQDLPPADITHREAPPQATEWIVLNESARGFALRYMSGALPTIGVGEIVAVRTRDRRAIFVCLVRWVLSNNPEHLEVGLQQLGPVVVPAVYKGAEVDRSAPEPILFFPGLPRQKQAPVVAAPPRRVHANEAFSLRHRLGRMSLCASRVIETTPSVELIEVVTLQTAADAA